MPSSVRLWVLLLHSGPPRLLGKSAPISRKATTVAVDPARRKRGSLRVEPDTTRVSSTLTVADLECVIEALTGVRPVLVADALRSANTQPPHR